MNDTIEPTIKFEVRPGVAGFVDQVRARLSDLSEEEREELVGGLEADLSELVAERGNDQSGGDLQVDDLLGDPVRYADELRAAAGFGPSLASPRHERRPMAESTTSLLDGVRGIWADLMRAPGIRGVWEMLTVLRPLWWVARAWAAVQLLDRFAGNNESLVWIPSLESFGPLVWLAATVVSVQIGRGRYWPGSGVRAGRPGPRLLLAALNCFAVFVVLLVTSGISMRSYSEGFDDGYRIRGSEPGLTQGGHVVQNVFPYDAEGKPLTGVQLFDQNGRPLNVNRWYLNSPKAWRTGEGAAFNVFPLVIGRQADQLPTPPLAVVPPVTSPVPPEGDGSPAADSENAEGR